MHKQRENTAPIESTKKNHEFPDRKRVKTPEEIHNMTNKRLSEELKRMKRQGFNKLVYCSFYQKDSELLCYTNVVLEKEFPTPEDCKKAIEKRFEIELEGTVLITNWLDVPKDYVLS